MRLKKRGPMTKKLFNTQSFVPCCLEEFSPEDTKLLIEVSKALGNEVRFEIYGYLKKCKTCFTSNLVDHLPLAQSTISQHLKVLKESGVIIGTVSGTSTSYCINEKLMKRYYKLAGKLL